ncbi:uncharacterized protein MAM_05184 [Metarhizium album ARSEF 1941]|uniref:Uncharacterized protein n=1 Tax=Metarhizium album (strain ARSEF 1941) TaxID=1081103 RepID=A0A0B2WVY2_METAS|nr:uncharacterized protein MAM_05184 [Metarhizium album ARSEF 1941]KHN97075.1 hypothetical protein MAM_05184 [Metarhizium album ARSEF 1941]
MKAGAVMLLLSAAGAYCGTDVVYNPTIQAYLDGIDTTNFTTDADEPPSFATAGSAEPTCFVYFRRCNPVYFYQNWFLDRASNITLGAKFFADAELIVQDDKPVDGMLPSVQTITSTAVTDATTKGWKVGGRLGGEVGAEGAKGVLEFTGEYGEQWSKSTTETTQLAVTAPCPGNTRCTIETVTFYATFRGRCRARPVINCGGEMDACRADAWGCSQFESYRAKSCGGDLEDLPCSFTTPIIGTNGKPVAKNIIRRTPLAGRPDTLRRRGVVGDDVDSEVEFISV